MIISQYFVAASCQLAGSLPQLASWQLAATDTILPSLSTSPRAADPCRDAISRAAIRSTGPSVLVWFRNPPRPDNATSTAADIPPATRAGPPAPAAAVPLFRHALQGALFEAPPGAS